MAITKRVYWDACSWIALIQKEKILQPAGAVEDREMICKSVIEAARKKSAGDRHLCVLFGGSLQKSRSPPWLT